MRERGRERKRENRRGRRDSEPVASSKFYSPCVRVARSRKEAKFTNKQFKKGKILKWEKRAKYQKKLAKYVNLILESHKILYVL
jgi:hypothetical protein